MSRFFSLFKKKPKPKEVVRTYFIPDIRIPDQLAILRRCVIEYNDGSAEIQRWSIPEEHYSELVKTGPSVL